MSDLIDLRGVQGLRRCPHHWLVEPPNGAVSPGVCSYCGRHRQFYNTPAEEESWIERERKRYHLSRGELAKL